ncbi:Na+/H+ antiporter subunit E [Mycolicibacterium chitae]|uniref:Putative monovalent cation/H+ antiporter subunit E n=1 Tax=Mycolicibacterium chitae TaxID=1792 RepID=A0A3S4SC65_MYCCI|nr:Na+/H+ antiporter subunit E [Mycolicibacterium chitae]MCV7109333.1 Na+/H+ antiporter subunit E [Mycolicibacterium chitae]BBZ00993.1 Na+/H+ antiporter subunit E [Mycolicibacterium chitae]VEG49839.1 putative monovalent cation/H+ antiporter subunit E [Mycolicibacterium chitae]
MKKFTGRWLVLRIWMLIWLTLVWILLWGNFSAANVISGLTLALIITVLLPLPPVPVEGRVHPISLAYLILRVAWSLVLSSTQIAWLAIRPTGPPITAVLRAHMNLKSDLVLALSVNIMNVIPGSIVLEIDQERRMLYVHVIDASTEQAVSKFYRQAAWVERLLIRAFERDEEWRPAANGNNGRNSNGHNGDGHNSNNDGADAEVERT